MNNPYHIIKPAHARTPKKSWCGSDSDNIVKIWQILDPRYDIDKADICKCCSRALLHFGLSLTKN
jgi:hypothetical protein